jgi:hypothetical protein
VTGSAGLPASSRRPVPAGASGKAGSG